MKPTIIILAPILAWLLSSWFAPSENIQHGLFILMLAASYWLTQVIHLSVTALLIPVVAVLLGALDMSTALSSFAHPIIFLFLGGFALAAALKQHGIDIWIAQAIIKQARGHGLLVCLLLFMISAVLSMWISNTATVAMMLPIALGLLASITYTEKPSTYWFVLLGMAYSASIGGIATLVGSPPNAIAASALNIGFREWLALGLPITLVLLPIMWGLLYFLCKPDLASLAAVKLDKNDDVEQTKLIWNGTTLSTLVIFFVTALLWVMGGYVQPLIGIEQNYDTWVAIAAIVALHMSGSLSFAHFEKNTQWSVLLLFGGGLCLSAILTTTQASGFLANQIAELIDGVPIFVLLLVVIGFVVFMTEISSNTALAALMVPTFISIAQVIGLDPMLLASVIAIGASCAFMLPVATPPNAIVFASGYVPQSNMMRIGMMLNCVSILLLALWFSG
ncbi:SLC13 family permease [Bermanella sp. R86510]|uniref:SLC13 family permease n=1 Tax=unclassified Bermanella TaxID=2627862 RepID=UPI0037CBD3E6